MAQLSGGWEPPRSLPTIATTALRTTPARRWGWIGRRALLVVSIVGAIVVLAVALRGRADSTNVDPKQAIYMLDGSPIPDQAKPPDGQSPVIEASAPPSATQAAPVATAGPRRRPAVAGQGASRPFLGGKPTEITIPPKSGEPPPPIGVPNREIAGVIAPTPTHGYKKPPAGAIAFTDAGGKRQTGTVHHDDGGKYRYVIGNENLRFDIGDPTKQAATRTSVVQFGSGNRAEIECEPFDLTTSGPRTCDVRVSQGGSIRRIRLIGATSTSAPDSFGRRQIAANLQGDGDGLHGIMSEQWLIGSTGQLLAFGDRIEITGQGRQLSAADSLMLVDR